MLSAVYALASIVVPPPYLIELFQRRNHMDYYYCYSGYRKILSFSQCVCMCFHIVFNIIFVTMLYIAHNVSILLVSTNVFLQISQMRVNHSKKCMVTWLSCPDNLVIVDRFLLLWLLLFRIVLSCLLIGLSFENLS